MVRLGIVLYSFVSVVCAQVPFTVRNLTDNPACYVGIYFGHAYAQYKQIAPHDRPRRGAYVAPISEIGDMVKIYVGNDGPYTVTVHSRKIQEYRAYLGMQLDRISLEVGNRSARPFFSVAAEPVYLSSAWEDRCFRIMQCGSSGIDLENHT